MFDPRLLARAEALVRAARAAGMRLATAESCTGGLVSALLTEVAGASDVVDRGFVTYSNTAKSELLGVAPDLIAAHGAVSEAVARAMARGALAASRADLALSVTGIAGPGGGTDAKPVGLVWFATALAGGETSASEMRYGDLGRSEVRLAALGTALELMQAQVDQRATAPGAP